MSANWWEVDAPADQQSGGDWWAQDEPVRAFDPMSDAPRLPGESGFVPAGPPAPRRSLIDRAAKYAGEYFGGIKDALTAPVEAPGKTGNFADRLMAEYGDVLGPVESLTTLVTGAIAPAVAGIEGAITGREPTNADIERFTYAPRTAAGTATNRLIGAVAKPIADVAEATGADHALIPLAAEAQTIESVARGRKDLRQLKTEGKRLATPPTAQELASSARQAYQRAKQAGAVAAPEGYTRMASGLRASLREQGFNPRLHPKAAAVLDEIESTGGGGPVSFDDLEILRRQALAAERSIEADERRVAGLIIDRLDDYADALASGAEPVLGGNAPEAVAARKEARDLYSRSRKAMEIQELIERAQIRASQFSGSGEENALRTEFRQLAMTPKRMRRFTQEEQQAIKEVAFGTKGSNALRQLGKLAPTGGLSQWLGIGATMINPLAAAVPITGAAARYGATRMTRAAAQRAEELMRRSQPRAEPETRQNLFAQLARQREIDDAGAAFEAERAAAAAQGGIEVGELPVREITLETRPEIALGQSTRDIRNALARLAEPETAEPQLRNAAKSAVAVRTQSVRPVPKIEAEMRAIEKEARSLRSDSPKLLELDAQYSALLDELAAAKRKRNRVELLATGAQ